MAQGDVTASVIQPRCFQGIRANQSDMRIDIPTMVISGSFSLTLWMFDRNISSNFGGTIIRRNWANVGGILISHNGANSYYSFIIVDSGANQRTAQKAAVMTNNTWYHLSFVFDSATGTMYYYQDGILGGSVQNALLVGLDPSDFEDLFCDEVHGAADFNGSVSDVRFFTKALSAAEVAKIYGGGTVTDGLKAHWKLHGDATDATGNGYDGTMVNGAWTIIDAPVAKAAKDARVTANDKYAFIPLSSGREIMGVHIEEA